MGPMEHNSDEKKINGVSVAWSSSVSPMTFFYFGRQGSPPKLARQNKVIHLGLNMASSCSATTWTGFWNRDLMLMCEQPRRSSVVNRCSCQLSQLLRETELDYHRPAFSFILLMVGRRCGAAEVQRKATERFCTLSLHLKNAKNDIPFGHQGISFIGRVRFDFIWNLDEGESVSETFWPHGWRSTQSATAQIVLSILK